MIDIDPKKINPQWNLADALLVHHAAVLIAGFEPNAVCFNEDGLPGYFFCEGKYTEDVGECRAAFYALVGDISAGTLKATITHNTTIHLQKSPDWTKTTVARSDLLELMESKGYRPAFLFSEVASNDPDYLNPNHPRYAPELAAAVRAWQAVTDTEGKGTPKRRLTEWLRENADKFARKGNEVSDKAIERMATVANWQQGGGAPKKSDDD